MSRAVWGLGSLCLEGEGSFSMAHCGCAPMPSYCLPARAFLAAAVKMRFASTLPSGASPSSRLPSHSHLPAQTLIQHKTPGIPVYA